MNEIRSLLLNSPYLVEKKIMQTMLVHVIYAMIKRAKVLGEQTGGSLYVRETLVNGDV